MCYFLEEDKMCIRDRYYIINKPDDFELNETLECGQCFHFNKLDENDYVLTAFGHMLHIIQTEKEIVFYDTDEKLYMDCLLYTSK